MRTYNLYKQQLYKAWLTSSCPFRLPRSFFLLILNLPIQKLRGRDPSLFPDFAHAMYVDSRPLSLGSVCSAVIGAHHRPPFDADACASCLEASRNLELPEGHPTTACQVGHTTTKRPTRTIKFPSCTLRTPPGLSCRFRPCQPRRICRLCSRPPGQSLSPPSTFQALRRRWCRRGCGRSLETPPPALLECSGGRSAREQKKWWHACA